MNVIVFGASGMVGQAVLREVLADTRIDKVLVVGRTSLPDRPDRVLEIVHGDFYDFTSLADEMTGYDACFFCLGVTSAGKKEPEYRRITYDITLAAATVLARVDPDMAFLYVSGMGTDSSERGRLMWARVKGATENALLRLPFRAYGIRPGFILPVHGSPDEDSSVRDGLSGDRVVVSGPQAGGSGPCDDLRRTWTRDDRGGR